MKILITGATGQLGYALQRTQPLQINAHKVDIVALNRTELNLENIDQIDTVLQCHQPDIVINAAAYTAVDKAESDTERAYAINANAVKRLAQWCSTNNSIFVHVSTDFVFDGKKSSPYLPTDATNPNSVYGTTKRDGENFALAYASTYVVRTGWVYGEHGANFVKTMLRLASEREQLTIIADQIGTPTYAKHLAQMIWQLVSVRPDEKIYHFSDAGIASWYDFACAIIDEGFAQGLLQKKPSIKPISTHEYPTPAQRPAYSVLCKSHTWARLDIEPVHWRAALISMLKALD